MYNTYMVGNDDTFSSVAKKFNISEEMIKQFNGYNDELIPGMVLLIPKIDNPYLGYYMIQKGDTLYKIAKDNNMNVALLAKLNGLNETDYIYPNQVLLIPKAGSMLYFTMIGDTLDGVARTFKTDINDLILENDNIYLQPEQLIVYHNK